MKTRSVPSIARTAWPVLAGGLLALGLGGCGALGDMISKPSARVTGVRLEGLRMDGVTLGFDVEVANPYGVALPVAKLDYALQSGGNRFLDGKTDFQGTVPANGKQTIPLQARLGFLEVLRVLGGVRPGAVVPYTADLGIGVDAPGVGPLRLPVSAKGEFPVPDVPRISVKDLKWDSFSLSEAAATLRLDVGNTNSFPIDLANFAYGLQLGGVDIVTTSVNRELSLEPGQTKPLALGFKVTPSNLGLAALGILQGQSAAYRLNGTFQAMTPFGALNFPVGDSGQTSISR